MCTYSSARHSSSRFTRANSGASNKRCDSVTLPLVPGSATVSGIAITVTQDPDTSGVLTQSKLAVDSNGTQNESVVQDISNSNTATGSVSLTPVRSLMIFESDGTAWSFVSSSTY